MFIETKEAKQELAGYISEAMDIAGKKADLAEHLKDLKKEVSRFDITPTEFATMVQACIDRSKVAGKAKVFADALVFVDSLELDEAE
jgi:hypothetical protein